MKVTYDKKTFEFKKRMSAGKLLKQMQLLPEMVLVVRNGELITEDLVLEVDDEVEIIKVISGGS